MLTGCGLKYRLPDRNHPSCQVPYSQRPTCLEDSDCAQNFLCAYRGGFSSIEGRCTYIDCCDPWRNRRLEGGRSFCDIDINPDIINGSRRRRIAKGSGNTPQDVNRLINQFTQMQKVMRQMSKRGGVNNMKQLFRWEHFTHLQCLYGRRPIYRWLSKKISTSIPSRNEVGNSNFRSKLYGVGVDWS